MAKFCGKCGARLDEKTGLCPNCNASELKKLLDAQPSVTGESDITNQPTMTEAPLSKKETKKQEKSQKKADKKAAKKAKRAAMTIGQKVRSFFLKLLLVLLILIIIGGCFTGALVYFDLVDIPIISYTMQKAGLRSTMYSERSSVSDNYVPNSEDIEYDSNENVYYANNELIVFFSPGTTDEQIQEVVDSVNGSIVGIVEGLNMYQLQVPALDTLSDLTILAENLMENFSFILYATYDSAVPDAEDSVTAIVPNDPWNNDVNSTDWTDTDVDGSNWWIEAIDAQFAWAYNNNLSAIDVGICDSSFDIGHVELRNKYVFPNKILESRNKMDSWKLNVKNRANYHGTHVAGIIGAEANNKKGITGLVWNSRLLLAPYYKDNNSEESLRWDTSTYANLSYLVEAGAKVINFSQGKTNFLTTDKQNYSSEYINREGNLAAVSIAQLLNREYDFLVIQSAGNGTGDDAHIAVNAIQNGWFASITRNSITATENISIRDVLDHVIIVGAIEPGGNGYRCTSFSNFGSQVTICAPGKEVYSTVPGKLFEFGGGYAEEDGTSMAAPIVTGVCAMVWAANSELSGRDVKRIVCENTGGIAWPSPFSSSNEAYDIVNARNAVEAALNYTPEETELKGEFDQSSIPPGAVEFNGHYYFIYDLDTIKGWDAAQKYCESKGGYLATITDVKENTFLYSYIVSQGYLSAMFGLSRQVTTDTWTWVTGETFSYENWHNGKPNHQDRYNYYGMYYDRVTDGSWVEYKDAEGPFICEWGEYEIRSQAQAQEPVRTTSDERDVVLVLDDSASMGGTPIEETKKAATNFVDTILNEDASIGIVTYNSSAFLASDFLIQAGPLKSVVSRMSAGGNTNIEDGLATAYNMLQKSNAKKKIIVLMSDGEPNRGKEGDALVSYADEIKNSGVLIYTLGFFESMNSKSSAQVLMERLASDGCHYEVASADDLVFFFEDVADQINGQRYIYVRIACPVDVSVTYNGETLSSAENDMNLRTDFGTLTFEESENASPANSNDQTKVLRLKEGVDYDLQIVGTGRGIMNYTIGFMDENGDYNDFRRFENIKINKRTVIDTVVSISNISILNIDEDGDGKYDVQYKAGANEYGEEVTAFDTEYILIGVSGVVFLILIVIIFAVKKRITKKKGE